MAYEMFKFIPSQIIATVDQDITIHFVGTQGPSHKIKVDGIDKEIELKRGEIETITLHLKKTGTINFRSLDHQPSMVARSLKVLENAAWQHTRTTLAPRRSSAAAVTRSGSESSVKI